MKHPKYLTIEEAAQELGCHKNTVRNSIDRGELPGTIRKGRNVLIPASDIENLKQKPTRRAV